MNYKFYGVHVRTNRLLPGLPQTDPAPPDVCIDLAGPGSLPVHQMQWVLEEEERAPGGQVFQQWIAAGKEAFYVRLRFAEDEHYAEFILDPHGEHIWVTWSEIVLLEEVANLLLGPVLGRVMRLRGTTCLHANAVAINGQAIAIVGARGAGKSTTTAMLARMGCSVVTDDIAALAETEDGFLVQPGLPRLRLRPDAATLYGDHEDLPYVWSRGNSHPDKRYLDLEEAGHAFARQPLPLVAIYVLAARRPMPAAPVVAPLSLSQSLVALVTHTYANQTLNKTSRAEEFSTLSRLIAAVPVREVQRPDGLDALPEVCRVILEDVQALATAA